MRITLCDVGARDGLQNEPDVLAPAVRADLIGRLAATGLPRIEAVSFVRDDRVPQMAGAEEVVAAIAPREGSEYAGLALTLKGYERLRATALDRVNCTFAATETFNQRNGNMSLEDAKAQAKAIVAESDLPTTVTVSVAFGCPFEGRVDPGRVAALCEGLGADEVVLADTIGVATPTQVRRLVGRVVVGRVATGVHLHNTRNTGYANALAAVEAGAAWLDASVGGIGGGARRPPRAGGARAAGNVATEDLAYLLRGEGHDPGVDIAGLIEIAHWLAGELGHPLPGELH